MIRLAILLLACALLASAQQRTVAITIDDLPAADTSDLTETQAINHALMTALERSHAAATVFVNEKRVDSYADAAQRRALLREWVQHGFDLGNHGYAHVSANDVSVEEFEQEIEKGETSIKPIMAQEGRRLRFFRFPFNNAGDSEAKQTALQKYLTARGYEVAVCTVDNSDWVFARAYRKAVEAHDEATKQRIQAAYLEYTAAESRYFGELGRRVFGREIPQVMLLHANRLNADVLGRVLAIFEREHYRFVRLGEAQSDAAYKSPTGATKFGEMWGYRWAKTRGIAVDGRAEPEPPNWISESAK